MILPFNKKFKIMNFNLFLAFKHLVRFSTEKECYDYLFSTKWGTQPICPSCRNAHMNYYITTRRTYKCSECYKQFSLTQGTIFEKSRIPLTKWFICIYFFTANKRGVSSVQLSKLIGVTQRTAWFILHRLREALKEENNIILSGIVEADETFIMPKIARDKRLQAAKIIHDEQQEKTHGLSKKKRLKMGIRYKRGRKKGTTKEVIEQMKLDRDGKPYVSTIPSPKLPFEQGAVVLGMMERNGRIVMKRIGMDNRSVTKEIIYPILKKHVSADSILVTDQHIVYQDTTSLFREHLSVNHDIGYVIDGIHTNGIENAWKHLKKFIDGTYFHISKRHFDRYLDEHVYRWNRRKGADKELFESFMPLVAGKQITFNKLKQSDIKMVA